MTRSILDRIDRLDLAAARLMREPKTQLNTALRNLLFEEAGAWETAYDIVQDSPEALDRVFLAPSMLAIDALAEAILGGDPA